MVKEETLTTRKCSWGLLGIPSEFQRNENEENFSIIDASMSIRNLYG